MKLLIIEDEPSLARSVVEYLESSGFVVESAGTLESGLEKTALNPYDCVLVDVMLPDGNGFDLIKAMKRGNNESCVIVVSAKNSLDDKVIGLSIGADDYLTKPFQLAELNARILAVVRRRQHGGKPVAAFREIEIDTAANVAKVHGKEVDLTRKEYDLLLYFISNVNRALSKESIAEHLWGDYIVDADSFDFVYAHIKNLRKKLREAGADDYIRTSYGIGYVLKADQGLTDEIAD